MSDEVEVGWPDKADGSTVDAAYRVLAAVLGQGGAVGWTHVPSRAETADWLADLAAEVVAGRTRLATVSVAGRVEGLGRWSRYPSPVVRINADVKQVMVHPDARGHGLARVLVGALISDARAHRVETLTLDVRGNNHAAMALYESFGFVVAGRLPDFIAVGDERWDRVLYRLDLRTADWPVRRQGMQPVGPGASIARSPERPGESLAGPPVDA